MACQVVQHFDCDTGLKCFKYAVFVAGDNVSKTHFDDLKDNGDGEGAEFSKVDFNCLNEHYPVVNSIR